MIAFAANSVLCRAALGDGSIDAASFTVIRLVSGAATLLLLLKLSSPAVTHSSAKAPGSWVAALMLFVYAVAFSFAYISLDTGSGALILFGAVQLTMILSALIAGDRLHPLEWTGLLLAFAGFVYLVLPGVTAPPLGGFVLMAVAGIAWGRYTLLGRGSNAPLADTAFNFARSLPLLIPLGLLALIDSHWSLKGVMLATISGALASGVGYTVWYIALRGLAVSQAAVVQLTVPVLAAICGVIFVSEVISLRLMVASVMILGGVSLVVFGREKFVPAQKD
jgi:drug/metabolite transporter (DMT)-like permease